MGKKNTKIATEKQFELIQLENKEINRIFGIQQECINQALHWIEEMNQIIEKLLTLIQADYTLTKKNLSECLNLILFILNYYGGGNTLSTGLQVLNIKPFLNLSNCQTDQENNEIISLFQEVLTKLLEVENELLLINQKIDKFFYKIPDLASLIKKQLEQAIESLQPEEKIKIALQNGAIQQNVDLIKKIRLKTLETLQFISNCMEHCQDASNKLVMETPADFKESIDFKQIRENCISPRVDVIKLWDQRNQIKYKIKYKCLKKLVK